MDPIQHNTCNLKMSCQERIKQTSEVIHRDIHNYVCVSICLYLNVNIYIHTHKYVCTHTHAHRLRSTVCALENVVWLLAFAYDSTTIAAPETARSSRLQSTEGKSHTVKSYL